MNNGIGVRIRDWGCVKPWKSLGPEPKLQLAGSGSWISGQNQDFTFHIQTKHYAPERNIHGERQNTNDEFDAQTPCMRYHPSRSSNQTLFWYSRHHHVASTSNLEQVTVRTEQLTLRWRNNRMKFIAGRVEEGWGQLARGEWTEFVCILFENYTGYWLCSECMQVKLFWFCARFRFICALLYT